jgi:multiple sugar transport system permease protein
LDAAFHEGSGLVTRRREWNAPIAYLLLAGAVAFALFPVFWMISVSLRANSEIFKIPPAWLPPEVTGEAYARIVGSTDHLRVFANSYLVAIAVTVISLALAILAAYSFSRFDFRGSRVIQFFIVGTQMVPPVSLIIPYFILITIPRPIPRPAPVTTATLSSRSTRKPPQARGHRPG